MWTAIALFFRRYPRLITIVIAVGILLVGMIYLNNIFQNNKDLKVQVANLKTDTTYKANEITQLKYNVAFYQRSLSQVRNEIDSIKRVDAKQNPNLSNKYPNINELKNQRK